MEVKLIVVGGTNPGQAIPVPGPKFFIGRAEDCHLQPKSDRVSRHHAVILVEEGFVAIRDFGSKNGTSVNGQRVTAEQELKTGDRLQIGPLEFEVQLSVDVGGKKKPKVHSIQEAAARTVETASVGKDADDELNIDDWIGGQDAAGTTTVTHSSDTQPFVRARGGRRRVGRPARGGRKRAGGEEEDGRSGPADSSPATRTFLPTPSRPPTKRSGSFLGADSGDESSASATAGGCGRWDSTVAAAASTTAGEMSCAWVSRGRDATVDLP